MPLCRGAVEPAEPGRFVPGDAVPVEQQLAVECLGLSLAAFGKDAKERRALARIVGQARDGICGGAGCPGQNLNSTVPKTVRPGAIDA